MPHELPKQLFLRAGRGTLRGHVRRLRMQGSNSFQNKREAIRTMKIPVLVRRVNEFSLLFVVFSVLAPAVARAASPSAPQFAFSGQQALGSLIDAGTLADLRWPNFTDCRDDVKSFYESSNYSLAWLKDGRPTRQALAVNHRAGTGGPGRTRRRGLRWSPLEGSHRQVEW